MRSHGRFRRPALAITVLAAVISSMALLLPARLCSDATGCTRLDNKVYSGGECVGSQGDFCYRCRVTQGGNTTTCYEAPDPADGSNCPLDERDIPSDPWGL